MAGRSTGKGSSASVWAEKVIEVPRPEHTSISLEIVGVTPLIVNRMAKKAREELLLPKGRKTKADRASSLKHVPKEEFLDSLYLSDDPHSETLLVAPGVWFKRAIMGAALDVPGASKSEIGRLVWVDQERIPLWGIPKLFMAVTRSADINRTPDIRTRAIIPVWSTRITVSFISPMINETTIVNLLTMAGLTQGVGDWRPQKGSGTFGQFEVCEQLGSKRFMSIVEGGGKVAQQQALANPVPYDSETEELLSWFEEEVHQRGITTAR